MKMKALTLWQPWATLVAIGAKRIETRSWSTSHRGSLAIHAAKTRSHLPLFYDDPFLQVLRNAGYKTASDLPTGGVVATCQLWKIKPVNHLIAQRLDCSGNRFWRLLGWSVRLVSAQHRKN